MLTQPRRGGRDEIDHIKCVFFSCHTSTGKGSACMKGPWIAKVSIGSLRPILNFVFGVAAYPVRFAELVRPTVVLNEQLVLGRRVRGS